ncbi:MAG: type II toxin-antitoxin system ParD family antitoxin [Pseudomonadota bacterium]|nr:type II toxin-antitoxin system ParD family antitoxin [Pseudomonadota bacterium]
MHVSLTPELESKIKAKVNSGLYNNASEVIREALRFMESHEEWLYQLKLEKLRSRLAVGAGQAERGEFVEKTVPNLIDDFKHS